MGDKAYHGSVSFAVCGNGCVYAAGIAHAYINSAQLFQFLNKHPRKVLLLFCGGYGGAVMYGLSIHLDVAKEAFDNV